MGWPPHDTPGSRTRVHSAKDHATKASPAETNDPVRCKILLCPGTAGFCNALDHLFPQATLWLHGPLHCAHEYVSQGCRVVANPLGYARKNEQLAFDPQKIVRVEA